MQLQNASVFRNYGIKWSPVVASWIVAAPVTLSSSQLPSWNLPIAMVRMDISLVNGSAYVWAVEAATAALTYCGARPLRRSASVTLGYCYGWLLLRRSASVAVDPTSTWLIHVSPSGALGCSIDRPLWRSIPPALG